MTKNERILKEQVKELERLVEIKEEVIRELKDLLLQKNNQWIWPYTITSGTDIVIPIDQDPTSGTIKI